MLLTRCCNRLWIMNRPQGHPLSKARMPYFLDHYQKVGKIYGPAVLRAGILVQPDHRSRGVLVANPLPSKWDEDENYQRYEENRDAGALPYGVKASSIPVLQELLLGAGAR